MRTYYALINPEPISVNDAPIIFVNDRYGPDDSDVGSRPAIYEDEDAAVETLRLYRRAGYDHIELRELTIEETALAETA